MSLEMNGNAIPVIRGKLTTVIEIDQSLSKGGAVADAGAVGLALRKKVSVTDIVDDLDTESSDRPLSAKQGFILQKNLSALSGIDADRIAEMDTAIFTAQGAADDALSAAGTAQAAAEGAQTTANSATDLAHGAQDTADNAVKKSGDTMTGDLSMSGARVTGLGEPENETDAVTKSYADNIQEAAETAQDTADKAQVQHKQATAALTVSGWSDTTQTVSVSGVTEQNTVLVGAAPESHTAYAENNVRCTGQGAGTLTFTCESVPDTDLTANLVILD